MTKFSRIENPQGQGGLFQFEMGDTVDGSEVSEGEPEFIELTDAEQEGLDSLLTKIEAMGEQLEVDFAAGMLMKIKTLKGLTEERAIKIVNTVAVDGIVG
jgi:hypothetical protein